MTSITMSKCVVLSCVVWDNSSTLAIPLTQQHKVKHMNAKATDPVIETLATYRDAYLTHSVAADIAHDHIVGVLKLVRTPAWSLYETWRKAFLRELPEGISDEAARKRWSRLVNDAGVTIPKSVSPDAIEKQNQREAKAAQMAALSDLELDKKVAALKAAGAETDLKRYEAEQKRRAIEALKPEHEALQADLKAIREALKTLKDRKVAEAIRKLLKV